MRLVRSCPGQRDDHKLIAARCQGKEKRRREKGREPEGSLTSLLFSSFLFHISWVVNDIVFTIIKLMVYERKRKG